MQLARRRILPRPKASVTPALDVALKDQSFVYRTGDHLTGSDYQPTTNVYGDVDGRPLYLVGDSMAAQLATPAPAVAKKRGLALKPRSKATVSFVLPAEGPPRRAPVARGGARADRRGQGGATDRPAHGPGHGPHG
ncbi:hypothetical protein LP422_00145 [Janibacter limosus]|uniref:Uncharacterized protein n=1 Tax=Janibacter limosus TaxID=53458 RepID=A0AC61U4S4_9MICO|nr:hypothetical protein [Janibacter limosus]UUZ44871.1 hypothetical protein LP422_00145 [Janibacter limosus]